MKLNKQKFFIAVMLLTLAACGFKLRGQITTLPFETLYISAPAGQSIGTDLERSISAGTTTKIVNNLEDAEAVLQVIRATKERRILSLSGGGRVREYQLIFRVNTRLVDTKGIELAPPSKIVLYRNLPFLNSQVLAKEAEAEMLYRDMQADAVQRIIWRLSAISPS